MHKENTQVCVEYEKCLRRVGIEVLSFFCYFWKKFL